MYRKRCGKWSVITTFVVFSCLSSLSAQEKAYVDRATWQAHYAKVLQILQETDDSTWARSKASVAQEYTTLLSALSEERNRGFEATLKDPIFAFNDNHDFAVATRLWQVAKEGKETYADVFLITLPI
ncbi:MAG: hypothetical protein R3A45_09800 [Bdellovibrionota bacterium]